MKLTLKDKSHTFVILNHRVYKVHNGTINVAATNVTDADAWLFTDYKNTKQTKEKATEPQDDDK